jgi:hypothetical protein
MICLLGGKEPTSDTIAEVGNIKTIIIIIKTTWGAGNPFIFIFFVLLFLLLPLNNVPLIVIVRHKVLSVKVLMALNILKIGEIQMANVFISYGAEDGEEFAEHVKTVLELVKIPSFVARSDIYVGGSFSDIIDEEIDNCTHFVVILTEAACRSSYVTYEIARAIIKKKRIIPCKYQTVDIDKIPVAIRDRQYFKFETKETLARGVVTEVSSEGPTPPIPEQRPLETTMDQSCSIGRSRRLVEYERLLNSADNFVYCQGLTWKSFLTDRYADIFEAQLSSNPTFQLRLLLLDPNSELAAVRARARIYRDQGRSLREELDQSLKHWKSFDRRISKSDLANLRGRFDVRLYSDLPPASLLFIDKSLYVGFFTQLSSGGSSPFLLVEKGNGAGSALYEVMFNHFETVWEKSSSLFQ